MKNNLLTATIIGGILLFSTTASHANDPAADAVALAQLIASNPTTNTSQPELVVSKPLQAKRNLMDRLQERNQDDVKPLLASAKTAGVEHVDLYQSFIDLSVLDRKDIDKPEVLALLENATLSKNWQRKNLANLFLGSYFIHQRDNLKALKFAQQALEAIPPSEMSLKANDARYETYDLLHTAFTIDRNISNQLKSTKQLIEYGQKTGRDIDEVTVIHNIGYLFSKSRDFETASQITELLIDLQKDQPKYQQAIANYSHGTNLVEAEKYSESIPFLQRASTSAENDRFAVASKIRLSLAYSKTGQVRKSQSLIRHLETSTVARVTFDRMKHIVERSKGENARRLGDYKSAYKHLNAWSSVEITDLQTLITEDRRMASEGLALSERVAQEREARLQSEVVLSNTVAQRGKMIAIFAGLLALALAFITFNLNRQRKRQIQINAELALARDQALAGEKAKSSFLSMMGHELRTPMNPIISLAEILYARVKDNETKQMLKMISASGRTMLSMVENILIVADETKRKMRISPQRTKIREFIRFTSQAFQRDAEDKGVEFTARIDPNVPEYLNVDKLKLRSIMTNILSNAVKFTNNGTVNMNILIVDDSYAGVSMLLSVKDTGTGMTQEEIDNLRAVFKQRDASHTKAYDGVGVGLYVSELYTKAHGGRMVVASHPEDGTRVDIYLPLQQAATPRAVQSSPDTRKDERLKKRPQPSNEQEAA